MTGIIISGKMICEKVLKKRCLKFDCIGTSKTLALANEQSWNLVLHCHISSKPQLLQMGC